MKLFPGVMLLLLAAVAQPASAQVAYHLSLNRGTQVRIEVNQRPGRKITGEVFGIFSDTLVLHASEGLARYAVSDLRKLQIRSGLNRTRGMLIGTGIGAAIGYLENTEERSSVTFGTALIGTLIGYAFAPKGWEQIPLPAQR